MKLCLALFASLSISSYVFAAEPFDPYAEYIGAKTKPFETRIKNNNETAAEIQKQVDELTKELEAARADRRSQTNVFNTKLREMKAAQEKNKIAAADVFEMSKGSVATNPKLRAAQEALMIEAQKAHAEAADKAQAAEAAWKAENKKWYELDGKVSDAAQRLANRTPDVKSASDKAVAAKTEMDNEVKAQRLKLTSLENAIALSNANLPLEAVKHEITDLAVRRIAAENVFNKSRMAGDIQAKMEGLLADNRNFCGATNKCLNPKENADFKPDLSNLFSTTAVERNSKSGGKAGGTH